MRLRNAVEQAGKGLIVLAVIAVVIGGILGQPILISFVETGSMQPALDPGDGFIAVPSAVAGEIERGDVIVFDAESLNGGGLVTHRVVDRAEQGYITQGDNNEFRDQSGEEPPVKNAQVVAVALRINGDVVAIPHLGTAVQTMQGWLASSQRWIVSVTGLNAFLGAQGLTYLFFLFSVCLYTIERWRESRRRSRERGRRDNTGLDARAVVGVFAVFIMVVATMSMVAPAGTQKYGVVSAEFDSPGARVIPTDESETTKYHLGNGGVVPVIVFLEPSDENIDVEPSEFQIPPRNRANATITLSAPPETGYYRHFLVEHRYLALLPESVIEGLYRVHPWLPIIVIDVMLGVPFYLLGIILVGTGRIRKRSSNRPSSVTRMFSKFT